MKFFRHPIIGGDQHQKNNNNKNSHQMGQFSSSEAIAGKAVVLSTASAIGATENAGEMRTTTAIVGAKQGRAHSLASAAPFRPTSQPIDILGKARHRSEVVQKMPMPIVPHQQNGQQHQPRVIQPRRLNNNANPSATSLGPMRANGREEFGSNSCRERIWQEAMRRRLLSLDARPVEVDPECPSFSGENNKENDRQNLVKNENDIGKQLSRSRKRLNSAELEYNGNGREEESSELEQMESSAIEGQQQKGEEELHLTKKNISAPESGNPSMMARKTAGRIAYLYGVYGQQERPLPYSQLLFATQQKPQMMEEEDILAGEPQLCQKGGGWGMMEEYGGCHQINNFHHQHLWCCSDSEDECLEFDGEFLEDEPLERLARLHSVSDIIGYAKVVRAQRQETLCRLDDVMSQFDALIRSYSMAMKSQQSQTKMAAENDAAEMPPQQPSLLTAPIVQSKGITN